MPDAKPAQEDVVQIGEYQTETFLLLDENDNPLGITPKPKWGSSTKEFMTLTPSADGSSCEAKATGKVGQTGSINVTFTPPGGGGEISRSIHCVIVEAFKASIVPASKHQQKAAKESERKASESRSARDRTASDADLEEEGVDVESRKRGEGHVRKVR